MESGFPLVRRVLDPALLATPNFAEFPFHALGCIRVRAGPCVIFFLIGQGSGVPCAGTQGILQTTFGKEITHDR